MLLQQCFWQISWPVFFSAVFWAGCSKNGNGREVPGSFCTGPRSDVPDLFYPCSGRAEKLQHKGQVSITADNSISNQGFPRPKGPPMDVHVGQEYSFLVSKTVWWLIHLIQLIISLSGLVDVLQHGRKTRELYWTVVLHHDSWCKEWKCSHSNSCVNGVGLFEHLCLSFVPRCVVASLLTVALHHDLPYLTQLMEDLLQSLMDQPSNAQPKLLLRRTESIVEKLLTNWMSICLYGFLRVSLFSVNFDLPFCPTIHPLLNNPFNHQFSPLI